MSLFGFLGKKNQQSSEFQAVSYQMAYGVLPHAVFKDASRFIDSLTSEGAAMMPAQIFIATCQILKLDPCEAKEIIPQLELHQRRFPDGRAVFIVAYPKPTRTETHKGAPILPPYYSIVVENRLNGYDYFVLGRSPSEFDKDSSPNTTFRQVTREGANLNLGPGPEPSLENLWSFLRTRLERPPAVFPTSEPRPSRETPENNPLTDTGPTRNARSSTSSRGAQQTTPTSLILQWAEEKMEEIRYEEDVTPESLFIGFIYVLATFAKPGPQEPRGKDLLPFENESNFADDLTLFELGCYLLSRVDLWLFMNRSDLRDRICEVLHRRFISLFTQVLEIGNAAEIVQQRIDTYGQLTRSKADVEKYNFYLSQFILRTSECQAPQLHDVEKAPLIIADAILDFRLKFKLMSWETSMLPVLIEGIRKTTDLMK